MKTRVKVFPEITIFLIFLFPFVVQAQEKKNFQVINEISVSVNRTTLDNGNVSGRFGFGLGVYKSWRNESWFNIVAGASYQKTGFFGKNVYNGHFSHVTDVDYNVHTVSVPVSIRLNVGRKTKFFLEPGAYLDLNLAGNRKGTFYSYAPGSPQAITVQKEKIRTPPPGAGFLAAVGSRIPVGNLNMVVKCEYKLGFSDWGALQESLPNQYVVLSLGVQLR